MIENEIERLFNAAEREGMIPSLKPGQAIRTFYDPEAGRLLHDAVDIFRDPIGEAAEKIGAKPSDIAGLWTAPGYPELTTGQLMQIASGRV